MNHKLLQVHTTGPGLYEVTRDAANFVQSTYKKDGLLTVFVRHTSCSLLIQENADPDVKTDLNGFFRRLVPPADDPSMQWVAHQAEGPDDLPAHVKSALTQTTLGIPVIDGHMMLGMWQGIYLFEHRQRPSKREIVFFITG
jgi:secondary thiamine-phosphate synthase enzyme